MKLGSIQFLRALAAILVAYAHSIDLQTKYTHSFQQDFYHLEDFGAFGVDIFFVISGFIITYSAGRYKGMREGLIFLFRRFKRVNPVHYLATLAFIVVFIPAMSKHLRVFPFPNILQSIILLPLIDGKAFVPPVLIVAWTLSFEWFFYLLFFLAIFSRTRFKVGLLLLLITALVGAGLLCKDLINSDFRLNFITNPILLEFGLGVGLYGCYTTINISKKMAFAFLLAGSGLCLYEIFKGFGDVADARFTADGSQSLMRFFVWGIPAGLLVAGCIFLEKARSLNTLWNNSCVALLGDSSYSLYLVNLTVYLLCEALYRRTGFFLNPDLAIWVQLLLALTGGILFYKAVEKPLLKVLHQRLHPGPVS